MNGLPTRRERLRQATINEIKSLAREEAKEKGIENVTVNGIARQMGMTAPAFYSYFKSRHDLIKELVLEAYQSFRQALTAAIENIPESDGSGRIYHYFLAWREWALQNPHYFNLFAGGRGQGFDNQAKEVREEAERLKRALIGLFDNAWKQGLIQLPKKNLEFPEEYQKQLEQTKQMYKFESPPEVINIGMRSGWLVHGLISFELSGRLYSITGDTELHYQYQIQDLLMQIGITCSFQ